MKIFDSLLSLVAPYDCLGCGAEGSLLCAACRAGLTAAVARCYKCHAASPGFATCPICRPVSPLRVVWPAVKYRESAKDLIWKLKFGRGQAAAAEAAGIICQQLGPRRRKLSAASIIITHAPTATSRVRQRGYDQAQLIALSLSRELELPYHRLLARRGHQEQIGASKAQRALQLSGAFYAVHPSRIRGAHVIVVDDVITTGATLEAAATALLAAGARRVDAVVLAQA
jgi:ComF family protein